MIGPLLVVGVLLMGGLPVSAATVASGQVSAPHTMDGMSERADVLPAGTAPDSSPVMGCDAMCGDLLQTCLAVLALLTTAATALACRLRPISGRPLPLDVGNVRRWVMGGSPPWSVLSLSQLSVLRV